MTMDLATLEMTPDQAAERLRHYQAQLTDERTAEDEAIAAGYRAAARGLPVISLTRTMAAGGWFPNGLPRLAVVRADATVCWVHVDGHGNTPRTVTFCDRDWDRGRARVGAYRVAVDMPAPTDERGRRPWKARTIVPVIPPEHRPNRRRLHRFHILWEVEQWELIPPRDPALLRHIRGDLWAVQAVWDLTDLERAVLSARAE